MTQVTKEAIYLGHRADADSSEFSTSLENPGVYLGTFGSSGDPLHAYQVGVTFDDANNSGDISTDNTGSETISYFNGSGTTVSQVDSLAVVNVTVTYADGSSQAYSNAVVFQDTTGNMFLTNSNFAGTDLSGPHPIVSVNITAVTGSNYAGLYHNALQEFECFVAGRQKTAPVCIRKGALGAGLPDKDLLLSQQHRLLVRSRVAERMFGTSEVLIPPPDLVAPKQKSARHIPPGSRQKTLCARLMKNKRHLIETDRPPPVQAK